MNTFIIGFNLLILLVATQLFIFFLCFLDIKKKRGIKKYPFASFIISAYNDEKSIANTIESIYNSYEKEKIEVFVINDGSNDNTLNILNDLKKRHKFNLINNEKNKGKSQSINKVLSKTKGGIIIIIDSDVILSKNALDDIVARFNSDKNIGAISCGYKPKEKSFFSNLQGVDYNMLTRIQGACNLYSTISLFGGCMAVKKDVLLEVGGFTKNAINEDTDLALKINKANYRVEQSFFLVETESQKNINRWCKQKIRWGSGFVQCFLRHFKTYIKNPIFFFLIALMLVSFFLSILLVYNDIVLLKGVFKEISLGHSSMEDSFSSLIVNGKNIFLGAIFGSLILPLLFLQYIPFERGRLSQNVKKALLIYPFAWIYFPVLTLIYIYASFRGVYKFLTMKENDVGWKKF